MQPCAKQPRQNRHRCRPPALALAALAALALTAAACATAPPPGEMPGVAGLVVGSRVVGRDASFVEVSAVHRSRRNRLVRITLVDPDGREVEAEQTRQDQLTGARYGYPTGPVGSIGIGGSSGGSVGLGLGIAIPFSLFSRGPYSRHIYRTRATIRVPDPDRYLENSQAWRLKLYFVHNRRGPHTVVRAAPLPPG